MKKAKFKKHFQLLQLMSKLTDGERNILVKYLSPDVLEIIYECIHNGLTNKKIDPKSRDMIKKTLNSRKEALRYLSTKGNSKNRKRILIQQEGGSLGLILSTVLPLLTQLLT